MDPSTRSSKRKEPPSPGGGGAPKPKRVSRTCSVEGCTNQARSGYDVCTKHGAKKYFYECSFEGCTKRAQSGGVCWCHGTRKRQCSFEGRGKGGAKPKRVPRKCSIERCTNQAVQGGVCNTHGAPRTECSVEGCDNIAVKEGVCMRHGAEVKTCSVEGCDKYAQKGGVCVRHGAPKKKCSVEGCTNNAVKRGVCHRHGAKVKKCKEEGCTRFAVGGLNGHCCTHSTVVCSRDGCESKARVGGLCMWHYVRRHQNQTSAEANVEAPAEARRGGAVAEQEMVAVRLEVTEAGRASGAATRTRRTRMRGQRQVSCLQNLPGGEIDTSLLDNLMRSGANDNACEEVDGECMLCCEPYQADAHRSRLVCSAEEGCGTFAMCRLCVFRSSIILEEPVEIDNEAGYSFVHYDTTVCPQCRKGGAFQGDELPDLPEDIKMVVEAEIREDRDREQIAAAQSAFEDLEDNDGDYYEPPRVRF